MNSVSTKLIAGNYSQQHEVRYITAHTAHIGAYCLYFTRSTNDLSKNTRYAQRPQTSADPEDPDFGLWTPGSEA